MVTRDEFEEAVRACRSGGGKDCTGCLKGIKRRFVNAASSVWNNLDASYIRGAMDIKYKVDPRQRAIVHIEYPRNVKAKAIWRSVIRMPSKVTLSMHPRFCSESRADQDALLRHEALHLGYPKHTRDFRKIAEEVDAPITETALRGGGVTVQVKPRARGGKYKTIKTFDDVDEAMRWGRKWVDEHKDMRARVQY